MDSSPGYVITSVQSSMNTSDFSIYQIIAIVIIFLIVASIIYYMKDSFYYAWRKLYPINELTGESALLTGLNQSQLEESTLEKNNNDSTPLTYPVEEKVEDKKSNNDSLTSIEKETHASSEQTWCLVGEDNAGRWCIQVQSPAHCEPVRSYKTKNQCEQSNEKTIVA
jgi:hypothetical protein